MDITDHLNNLNRMLQGHNKVVTQYYDNVRAFKTILALWVMHFLCKKDFCNAGSAENLGKYKDKISSLLQ